MNRGSYESLFFYYNAKYIIIKIIFNHTKAMIYNN